MQVNSTTSEAQHAPPGTGPLLTGPAALNAISEDAMRGLIVSVLSQPFESQPVTAPAMLAPFVTLRASWLMHEVIVKMIKASQQETGAAGLARPNACGSYRSSKAKGL